MQVNLQQATLEVCIFVYICWTAEGVLEERVDLWKVNVHDESMSI